MRQRFGAVAVAVLSLGLSATGWSAPHDIAWFEGTQNPVITQSALGAGRAYYASVLFDTTEGQGITAGRYRAWFDASSGNDIATAMSDPGTISGGIWSGYTLVTGLVGE